jgi:signal transduction histidine kinase
LGIPETILPNLFDPFFTTKAVGKGTGLGLSIAHSIIVQRHRGQIEAQSRPGHTRFTVRLPLEAPTGA